MSRRSKRSSKFTREGFPKPQPNVEYDQDEIVWVLINKNLPYWPSQIKTGGTIFSVKKQKTTKGLKKIQLITFNDPDLSVVVQNKDNIINETKQKKRKKDLTKRRSVERNKILKWEQKKKDNTEIDYDDILSEYIKRMKLHSVDDIDASIFKQWNDIALNAAEQELKRMAELLRLEAQRKLEHEQLRKARAEEITKAESMKGQIYDGRIWNEDRNDWNGWELTAGDTIRYWAPSNNIANSNNLITTKIIKLRDRYGTLRLKDTVPIDVLCDNNPPFWNTEIELLPAKDPMHPMYYPLSQCMFNPSQIENEMEKKHLKARNQFKKGLKSKGWGNMLYNGGKEEGTDEESEGKEDTVYVGKKKRRKRKKRLSDTDSDVIILDKTTNNRNIINEGDSLKLTFEKKKRTKKGRKRKSDEMDSNVNTKSKQPRKKRRLNNPKDTAISIDDIMEKDVIEGDSDKNMDVDDSEDEPLWPHVNAKDNTHNNNDSDCEITKVIESPKNKRKYTRKKDKTSDDDTMSPIPWPASPKIKKKRKVIDCTGDTTNSSPKKSIAKRKVRRKVQPKNNKKMRRNSNKENKSDISKLRNMNNGTGPKITDKLDGLINRQERTRTQSPDISENKNQSNNKKKRKNKSKRKKEKMECKKSKNINKASQLDDQFAELLAFEQTFDQ